MKTKIQQTIILSLFILLSACAQKPTITHKRGNDPSVAIQKYKEEKTSIQPEIARILNDNRIDNGTLVIEWTVNDKGQVLNPSISEDSVGVPELNDLILNHLKSIQFPKTPMFMTSSVEYRYHFSRKQ